WLILVQPELIERTRYVLGPMVNSIDAQLDRVRSEGGGDAKWFRSIEGLKRHVRARYDALPPPVAPVVASSREARGWRAFSARLAAALEAGDTEALDSIKTPY